MVVDGILWIMRTGAPWRDFPEEFGKCGTVYDLFTTWNRDGALDENLDLLLAAHVDAGAIDNELWCVDGATVRAAKCAAGAVKGGAEEASCEAFRRSRGGFSTKIHLLFEPHGQPLHAVLSPGKTHESNCLHELLETCKVRGDESDDFINPIFLAGDKGYRAEWVDECLVET